MDFFRYFNSKCAEFNSVDLLDASSSLARHRPAPKKEKIMEKGKHFSGEDNESTWDSIVLFLALFEIFNFVTFFSLCLCFFVVSFPVMF